MSDPQPSIPEPPRRRVRFGRILIALMVLGIVAASIYGASWLNARRYFLVVKATEVEVHKGRQLPVGHEPFVPFDPHLRRAYQAVPLPGGMKLPRGETVFDDRVQLDQALYRILVDATEFALQQNNARTSDLVQQYLEQLKALPGTNVQQQMQLQGLERAAGVVEARGHVTKARALLERAEKLLRESAAGAGAMLGQELAEARRVARARAVLDGVSGSNSEQESNAPAEAGQVQASGPGAVVTSTATTTSP